MDNFMQGFSVILGLLVLLAVLTFYYLRPLFILKQWADENQFELLRSERRKFLSGPFFFTLSHGRTVFRVTVRARDGKEYMGWVRCGGRLLDSIFNKAEVRWN